MDNITVKEGDSVSLAIKFIGGNPKPLWKWFKDDKEVLILPDSNFETAEEDDSVRLLIHSVKYEDTGVYHIQLSNKAGDVSSNKAQVVVNSTLHFFLFIFVHVILFFQIFFFLGAPVFIKLPDAVEPVCKDGKVKFECMVDGMPKPSVTWSINGKELSNKDGVQIEKDVSNNRFSLNIPKVNAAVHAGLVTVKASNTLGSVQHEILLSVYGKYSLYPWMLIFLVFEYFIYLLI